MQARVWKLVSLTMAILFPMSMTAGETGAMAVPAGNVTVNGNAISRPAAIFTGDRISTVDGSLAMTLSGSVVEVAPKSSVVLKSNQMAVSSGGVKVVTTTGMTGLVRNLSLQPIGSGKNVFTFAERDGKILIAALEGSLNVNDGRQQMTLAANHALAIPVAAATQNADQPTCAKGDKKCQSEMKKCKGDKDCEARVASGAAAAGGAAAGAAAAGAGAAVSTGVAVGITVAVAAASAAASFGIAKATEPSSPSAP